MGSVVEIAGIAGWAAMAGPLLLLATALMLALFWPHRADTIGGEHGWHEAAAPAAVAPPTSPASHPESSISNSGAQLAGSGSVQFTDEPAEPHTEPPPRVASGDVATTATEDTAIEATSSDVTRRTATDAPSAQTQTQTNAARALFDEALSERAAGNLTTAAECLRAAIVLATQSADRTLHAAARLELGDIVQAEGDLQTACEHWQMARSLFEDERHPAEAARCQKRMMKNRCPTDWVLNDF